MLMAKIGRETGNIHEKGKLVHRICLLLLLLLSLFLAKHGNREALIIAWRRKWSVCLGREINITHTDTYMSNNSDSSVCGQWLVIFPEPSVACGTLTGPFISPNLVFMHLLCGMWISSLTNSLNIQALISILYLKE